MPQTNMAKLLLLFTALCGCLVYVAEAYEFKDFEDGKAYRFLSSVNSYCLAVKDNSYEDNSIVEASVCQGDISLWVAKAAPNRPGLFSFVNKYTGKCLSMNSGTAHYTPIVQYSCQHSRYPELWEIRAFDYRTNEYTIQPDLHPDANICLANQSWFGGAAFLYDCVESTNQQYKLEVVNPAT